MHRTFVSLGSSKYINLMYSVCRYSIISIIYGLMIDPHNNQLPVGLIAQLAEHCTSIAEVRVSVPSLIIIVMKTLFTESGSGN